jgi:hypothetical protein
MFGIVMVGVEAGTCTEVTGTLELCFEDGLIDACLGVDPGGAFLVPVAEGGLLSGAFITPTYSQIKAKLIALQIST